MDYTAVVVKEGEWYAGFIKEIPGVNSQAKTLEELSENLKEAVALILESNYKHSLELCQDQSVSEMAIHV